jgi:hypothetical protein
MGHGSGCREVARGVARWSAASAAACAIPMPRACRLSSRLSPGQTAFACQFAGRLRPLLCCGYGAFLPERGAARHSHRPRCRSGAVAPTDTGGATAMLGTGRSYATHIAQQHDHTTIRDRHRKSSARRCAMPPHRTVLAHARRSSSCSIRCTARAVSIGFSIGYRWLPSIHSR